MQQNQSVDAEHTVWSRRCTDWRNDLPPLLDAACLADAVAGRKRILVKPNLVEVLPPPITTPVDLVASLVAYLQEKAPGAEIIIAEGCGSKEYDTARPFAELGYAEPGPALWGQTP